MKSGSGWTRPTGRFRSAGYWTGPEAGAARRSPFLAGGGAAGAQTTPLLCSFRRGQSSRPDDRPAGVGSSIRRLCGRWAIVRDSCIPLKPVLFAVADFKVLSTQPDLSHLALPLPIPLAVAPHFFGLPLLPARRMGRWWAGLGEGRGRWRLARAWGGVDGERNTHTRSITYSPHFSPLSQPGRMGAGGGWGWERGENVDGD